MVVSLTNSQGRAYGILRNGLIMIASAYDSAEGALAEIRYRLFMICHKLQAFKICGARELAGHRLSRWAETAIRILSLRAVLMEIGSHNLL